MHKNKNIYKNEHILKLKSQLTHMVVYQIQANLIILLININNDV